MSNTLSGSVAVVSGGARGIGRACALRLAELGAYVAIVDLDLQGAAMFGEELTSASVEEELRALSGDALGLQADLAEPGVAERVVAEVVGRWGRLDILVAVAGGAVTPWDRSGASVTTEEDLATLVDANLRTTVASCRAVVPAMRESGGGAIVTMGSSAGLSVSSDGRLAAYGMTKAAVHQYTRYLAVEVGRWGIRANCVAPGVIRTARVVAQSASTGIVNEAAGATIPLGRQGEPSDIADAVEYLTTPLSAYVSGQVLAVNGGAVTH